MKIYKFDCIGRVPSSIKDLEKCEQCQNEEICLGLSGVMQHPSHAENRENSTELRDYEFNGYSAKGRK